ncbi:hypothetical protein R69746_08300 [Paraburkholderia aspalathi]|nr:hypothetical protein R75465_05461 [Paraburkholderia aspalathi]CAE6869261.1 hypothetical protein R69746_08300 [Paraburkholderia aspalathi]
MKNLAKALIAGALLADAADGCGVAQGYGYYLHSRYR